MDEHECNIITFIYLSTVFEPLWVRNEDRHWKYGDEQEKCGFCLCGICGRHNRPERGR